MLIEAECNVNVRIQVPNTGDREVTEDDLKTMVSNALQHGHCGTGVQLVLHDCCQEYDENEPVICNTYIDVDLGSIERI